MNSFTGLDIAKIYTIVYKEEPKEFHFINRGRLFDGFVLVTSGTGYAVDECEKQYFLKPGDMLLLRKSKKYELHFSCISSYIASEYDLMFDKGGDFPIKLPFVVNCSETEVQSIKELCRIWQTRSWDAYTKCRIMLLELYIKQIRIQMRSTNNDNGLKKATEFIHENFKRNFSGQEIAKHCNMSLSYLRSRFLLEKGQTINTYRDHLRFDTAKEMLISRYFSVSEIAAELGFCDVYHFSKVFKKYSGLSPSAFLKSKQNSSNK